MHKARNMGLPAVKDHGILNTPPPPRLTSSSPSFPFRRLDPPPSFSPSRHDDGILPTPHFSTRRPPHSYFRRSGSSQALGGSVSYGFFYTSISCDAVDTWRASPFLFSPSLSPAAYTFSSAASRPRVSSTSFSPPSLPALSSRVTSLSSSSPSSSRPVPCPFLADINCHNVSLCRSLIPLPHPSSPTRTFLDS